MRTALGRHEFSCLSKVIKAVLSLLHSNADCEWVFTIVRKKHTDKRKSMGAYTLTALLKTVTDNVTIL